jgi:hypothetical protein
MAGADIALRVSTTGADEARAKLALVGETGTQALTRINAASSEASGGMEAFSTAIQRTSGAAQQLDIARQMLLNIETAAQRVAAAQQKINDLTGVAARSDSVQRAREVAAYAAQITSVLKQLDSSQIDNVIAALRGLDDVAVLFAEARKNELKIIEQQNAAAQALAERQNGAGSAVSVITNMQQYVASLSTSDASAGTAEDRMLAARRQFDAVYGAAQAGDARSISGLQSAAETFRQSSREIYGGGQGYADALRLIGDRLDGVAGMGADALTQSFVTENARQNTDRIVDALADLRRENAALRRDINMLLMRPAA